MFTYIRGQESPQGQLIHYLAPIEEDTAKSEHQVQRSGSQIKYVFLVGSFGQSPYLFQRVQAYTRQRRFNTIQPQFAWSAIVRGAMFKGLEGGTDLITLRRSRCHYGTPVSQEYSPLRHSEEDAYIDEHDGTKYARGQMSWLTNKGDALYSGEPRHATIDLCRTFDEGESRLFRVTLAACNDDLAPRRFFEDSVFVVTRLTADLSCIPLSSFPRAVLRPGGKPYYIAAFKIKLTLTSLLSFTLIYNDQEYAAVTAQYD